MCKIAAFAHVVGFYPSDSKCELWYRGLGAAVVVDVAARHSGINGSKSASVFENEPRGLKVNNLLPRNLYTFIGAMLAAIGLQMWLPDRHLYLSWGIIGTAKKHGFV